MIDLLIYLCVSLARYHFDSLIVSVSMHPQCGRLCTSHQWSRRPHRVQTAHIRGSGYQQSHRLYTREYGATLRSSGVTACSNMISSQTLHSYPSQSRSLPMIRARQSSIGVLHLGQTGGWDAPGDLVGGGLGDVSPSAEVDDGGVSLCEL